MHPMMMEEEHKKRQEAMQKRLGMMDMSNPIVKMAAKKADPEKSEERYDNFGIVEELVSAARSKYMNEDEPDLKMCVKNLAEALYGLANNYDKIMKAKASSDDKSDKKDNPTDESEEY